jgi:predicted outer membrane repeat protein
MEGGMIDHHIGNGVKAEFTSSSGGKKARFEMTGGSIEYNQGSGVRANYFTISGDSKIIHNTASSGAGIYVSAAGDAFCEIKDNVLIAYNTATVQGGGIHFVGSSSPTFVLEMSGGSVLGNKAKTRGAAYYRSGGANGDTTPDGSTFKKTGGVIYGFTGENANTATDDSADPNAVHSIVLGRNDVKQFYDGTLDENDTMLNKGHGATSAHLTITIVP